MEGEELGFWPLVRSRVISVCITGRKEADEDEEDEEEKQKNKREILLKENVNNHKLTHH